MHGMAEINATMSHSVVLKIIISGYVTYKQGIAFTQEGQGYLRIATHTIACLNTGIDSSHTLFFQHGLGFNVHTNF